MADPEQLRVSDEQRERVTRALREHFAAGRITEDELSDRVQAAYDAQTQAELDKQLADGPKLPATPQPVIALVRNGWMLYGPDPQLDRIEQELDRPNSRDVRR